jgi:hypothetical protein
MAWLWFEARQKGGSDQFGSNANECGYHKPGKRPSLLRLSSS